MCFAFLDRAELIHRANEVAALIQGQVRPRTKKPRVPHLSGGHCAAILRKPKVYLAGGFSSFFLIRLSP
jgi:hypothetical protein